MSGVVTLRALVTGIGGFAGSHMADYLLALDQGEVHGVLSPQGTTQNLDHHLESISLHRVDLTDYADVLRVIERTAPGVIYHLAARASVRDSWEQPERTLHNNIIAQLNLLRAVAELGASPRLLIVASADEYGHVRAEDLPVVEETPLRPVNPYAVSKVAQDYMGLQYHLSHGLHIVRVRPFNHSGPRQQQGFVIPDFCAQIAAIEAGNQVPILRVGDLSAERDIGDVRDFVRGYHLAVSQGTPGAVYNLGSESSVSIRDVLDRLLAMSSAKISVRQDPERMRPSDIPRIVSNCQKLRDETGWQPVYDLTRTLSDTLAYWRHRIASDNVSSQ